MYNFACCLSTKLYDSPEIFFKILHYMAEVPLEESYALHHVFIWEL